MITGTLDGRAADSPDRARTKSEACREHPDRQIRLRQTVTSARMEKSGISDRSQRSCRQSDAAWRVAPQCV